MQIQLVIENIEGEEILENLNKDSSIIFFKSISSWIVDYYFTEIYSNQIKITEKSVQPKNIISSYDMFVIYQIIQPSSSLIEFFELCKNKLKQIKNNFVLEKYDSYLNRCGLIDIIDLFHQCQLDSFIKRIILSIDNIQNDIDRVFFEYLVELSSSSCSIYNVKTKLITTETSENLLKLIDNGNISAEQTSSKNCIKHTLCTYLSLLLDTRNEHALLHCLVTPARIDITRETIIELQCLSKLSKNKGLTIYQILLSFLRRKELIIKQDLINNNDDNSFDILDKYYSGIKEFFDFIEQLQIIIEENEHLKIESIVTFRKLLGLISKQLRKDLSFNRDDLIINEIIEELCQCFQTIIPLMNCTSPIRSASSGATLAGRRFLRSVAYLCAKQSVDLPVLNSNNDHYDISSTTSSRLLRNSSTSLPIVIDREEVVDPSMESVFVWQSKTETKHRSLDLSIIHEISFESDSIINDEIDNQTTSDIKIQSQSIIKRQPLREIDINSFNNEEREIENEKTRCQNSIVLTLVSDGDKENLPVTLTKRSMISTKHEPPSKKHKKTNVKAPEAGQKMITSFFQSTC